MRSAAAGILLSTMLSGLFAAGTVTTDDLNAKVKLPTFEARLGIGFNYDLLHDPFDVSFDYPKGYFGMNLPLEKSINMMDYKEKFNTSIDTMINQYDGMFSNLEEFRPTVGARQNPNPSIRVDVPMMGGVASFANTQNFYLNYQTTLGNPDIFINPSPDSLIAGMSFLMRGTINVPINMVTSWETMSFGYAFEVNRLLQLALNLHRHVFYLDMRGKIDIDLLGRYNISMGDAGGGSGFEIPSIKGEIDYSSEKLSGSAYGHYETEVWTPSLAVKAWRFSCVSRFGINKTRVPGSFEAKYRLPFFVDPVTLKPKYDMADPDILNSSEMRQGLLTNASDSIIYSSRKKTANGYQQSDLIWNMPTGVTFAFDVIPERIKVSYTKLYGEISMKLDRIAREQRPSDTSTTRELLNDSLVIDYGVTIDNVVMLELNLFHSFLRAGIFSMDFRYADSTNLISNNIPDNLKFGDGAMLPVLSLGTTLGTKMQLLLELDLLPLPAIKTGVFYYF